MDWHNTLLFIHIMLLVFWLGTDIGVFVLGKFAQNPAYSVEQRMILLKPLTVIDMFPRVCLPLMVPTGFQLANDLSLIDAPAGTALSVWIVGFVWLAIVARGLGQEGTPLGATIKRIEFAIHCILIVVLLGVGGMSLATGAPFLAPWLAGKVIMFGLVMVSMILLERAFTPALHGFVQLQETGSTPDLETAIRSSMDRTYIWVLAIYLAVAIAAFLGTTKPLFN